jgi:hypothetical protein
VIVLPPTDGGSRAVDLAFVTVNTGVSFHGSDAIFVIDHRL